MATQTVNQSAAPAAISYRAFANSLTLEIFRLRYQARAAAAMLENHPAAEDSDDLTGVGFILNMIEERCSALSKQIGDADLSYVLKGECNV